jgi:hypothetical protein
MAHRDSAWCSANLLRNSACAKKCLSRRAGLTFKKAQSLVVLKECLPSSKQHCRQHPKAAGHASRSLDSLCGGRTCCERFKLQKNSQCNRPKNRDPCVRGEQLSFTPCSDPGMPFGPLFTAVAYPLFLVPKFTQLIHI